jgi:hypothetical protein
MPNMHKNKKHTKVVRKTQKKLDLYSLQIIWQKICLPDTRAAIARFRVGESAQMSATFQPDYSQDEHFLSVIKKWNI